MSKNILDTLMINSYGYFLAEACKETGLPMLKNGYKGEYSQYINKWLSLTRCKKNKLPVKDNESPVAFYRVQHGYVPLYDRTEFENQITK